MGLLDILNKGIGLATANPLTTASLALGGIGGLLANKGKTQQQTSINTPMESPAYTGLRDLLMKYNMDRLNAKVPLAGYEGTGLANINKSYDMAATRNANNMTARGLGGSPIAGVVDANMEASRAGDISGFENQLPLMERNLQNQDWQSALNLFQTRPVGSMSTGTATAPGNMASGALYGMGDQLGYLMYMNQLNKNKGKGTP